MAFRKGRDFEDELGFSSNLPELYLIVVRLSTFVSSNDDQRAFTGRMSSETEAT